MSEYCEGCKTRQDEIERLRAALEKIVGTAGETIPVPAGLNVNAYAEGLRRNQDIASAVLAETVADRAAV